MSIEEDSFNGDQQDINESFVEAQETLDTARDYFGLFYVVISVTVLLALLIMAGIMLIIKRLDLLLRVLDIVFLIYGAIEYISIRILNGIFDAAFIKDIIDNDMPNGLVDWLVSFIANDFFAPMEIFAIAIFVFGVVLLFVSILLRRNSSVKSQSV